MNDRSPKITARRKARRGLTLPELLVSMTIIAIVSVGASNLIVAGLRTDRVLLDANRQVSDMELSVRRLIHNIRTGSGITLTGTTGITLTSQADPNNNGQTYTITYTYDSTAKTLTESTTQYGSTANVIAYNVTAFSVTAPSASPLVLSIDMTIAASNTAPATRRAFQVLNRNS